MFNFVLFDILNKQFQHLIIDWIALGIFFIIIIMIIENESQNFSQNIKTVTSQLTINALSLHKYTS